MINLSNTPHPANSVTPQRTVDQLNAEIFLPSTSSFGPGTLLISRDGEEDCSSVRISPTARTSLTEIEFCQTKKNPPIHSRSSFPFDHEEKKNVGCQFFSLLKSCWSWFCGLDDNSENDPATTDVSYHRLKRQHEQKEAHDFMVQHLQESSWIKWVLNGNLVFIILVEIFLFLLFSIPVKYTFWRE